MTAPARKPRPRRIAADEAHSWARNLRLGNPYAKLVLSMLTIYVNGEGSCYVSIGQLAEDCELAENTIRRRLAFLEQVGAIARFPQWRDEHGRMNREGRGRRTTDDIRLMIYSDPEEIEAKAAGNIVESCHDDDEIRGSPGEPLETISPSLGVQQPSHCGEDLTSEPEPEKIPPNPPSGGERVVDEDLEKFIDEFVRGYPAPITNLPRLRTVLTALTVDERAKVITAERGYSNFIAECERKGKPRAVKDAHTWVANGLWQGYLTTGERAEAAARIQQVAMDSDEGKALLALHRIAHLSRPFESNGRLLLRRPLSPQALALAHAPPDSEWVLVPADQRNQCGAWNELLSRELEGKPRPELVWDRNPGGVLGFMAPWPWPPRKDGTLCDSQAA